MPDFFSLFGEVWEFDWIETHHVEFVSFFF